MSLLIRRARVVGGSDSVDVRVRGGEITAVAPALEPSGDHVVDADGRWVMPGLWDQHVHFTQWARARQRVDVSGTGDPADVVAVVADHVARRPDHDRDSIVVGYGFRLGGWDRVPTAAELDAVSGDHPVVLISGDVHAGWLNTAAAHLVGVGPGVITEGPWFAVLPRLTESSDLQPALDQAMTAASRLGVVGITDFEFTTGWTAWPRWAADGLDRLRVRPAVYPEHLDEVLELGLRTGDPLDAMGLIRMGPLKIISDGSLNTRTAFCDQPYADDHPGRRGQLNYPPEEVIALLRRATGGGLEVAVHAIGDAAVATAVEAFRVTGARGSIEHAQLVRLDDLPEMARLGVTSSVQPAHLLDDRDLTERCWPDRADRCFALRSMIDAGLQLALGSDAPVSPLDPWLAVSAAVDRTGDARPSWHPEQSITATQALAASTDGQSIRVGARGDLVLVEHDPLSSAAPEVAMTTIAGRIVHESLS